MKESGIRTQQLQLIPVFALRQLVYDLSSQNEEMVQARFQEVLNKKPRRLNRAIQRLRREDLVRLIAASEEISDQEIQALFEEYRYGTNPSFNIYLFNPSGLDPRFADKLEGRIEAGIEEFNRSYSDEVTPVRKLALNDLGPLGDRLDIIEGHYRFQKRLDFIDESEVPVSVYQTLYGFFWINTSRGYATIQARDSRVLNGIRRSMEGALQVPLTVLIFTRQLKDLLPFLDKDQLRAGRLHHPDPGPGFYRWLALEDDAPYEKGYAKLEASYPELRTLRYREKVSPKKITSLTIRCDRGNLRLAGKLGASEFRAWCQDRLETLLDILAALESDPDGFLKTLDLVHIPELAGLKVVQRKRLVELLQYLLTAKINKGKAFQNIPTSPFELAADLQRYFQVRIPIECEAKGCTEQGYLACPLCEGRELILEWQNPGLRIACPRHPTKPWETGPPIDGTCEETHPFQLDTDSLAERLELLPNDDLLELLGRIIAGHLRAYSFNPEIEGFILRGKTLIYFPDRKSKAAILPAETGKTFYITIHQDIGHVEEGEVVGLKIE